MRRSCVLRGLVAAFAALAWVSIGVSQAVAQMGDAPATMPPAAQAEVPTKEFTEGEKKELAEAWNLNGQVMGLWKAGKYREALAPAQSALRIRGRILGPGHPDTCKSLFNLGAQYEGLKDYDSAEQIYKQALANIEQTPGKNDANLANYLVNLAEFYKRRNSLGKVEEQYERLLQIVEKNFGPDHANTANTLRALASLIHDRGAFERTEPLLVRELGIWERIPDPNRLNAAFCLNFLAVNYVLMGERGKAEPLYKRALAIYEEANGPDHPSTATPLYNLGVLYSLLGDDAQAETFFLRALKIREKSVGPAHESTILSTSSLANVYAERGDYSKAEPLFKRALAAAEAALGRDHLTVSDILMRFSGLYSSMGDYQSAEPLLIRALDIRERVLEPGHPFTTTTMNNLAHLYASMGAYAKATDLYLRALSIKEKAARPNFMKIGVTLTNLGGLYRDLNEQAKAKSAFQRALEAFEKSVGPEHPLTATCLNDWGTLHSTMGEHAEAEVIFLRALRIRERALADHPRTVLTLWNLAFTYRCRRADDKAEGLARKVVEATLKHLDAAAVGAAERQQLAMMSANGFALDTYLGLALAADGYQETAYEFNLRWKGNIISRQRLQRAAADAPELAPKFAELRAAAARLSTLALQTPEPSQQAAWQRQVQEHSATKERLEQELSRASAAVSAVRRRVRPADVQAALEADTALVDFVDYSFYPPADKPTDGEWRLAAFVVTRSRPLKLLDLAPTAEVIQAMEAWRSGGYGASAEARRAAKLLREKLWQPLEPHLAGVKTVLVSPVGGLGRLPLAALPGRKPGTYLIEDYALATVPVPSALADPPGDSSSDAALAGLLALGDVNYDQQGTAPTSPTESPALVGSLASLRAPTGGKALRFAPLRGTGLEIAAVEKAFRSAHPQVQPKRLAGDEANEAAFRAAASHYRFLHLATHGFFADPSLRSALSRQVQAGSRLESDQSLVGYHPDLLSGVALAGVNQPASEGDDGILTAAEVQTLDLRRAAIVTLSACETGLGAAADGEGLLGLQRAFQVAGAKNVVASLWKVDDAATQALMIEFYANLWQKKLPPIEALRQAQLKMLVAYQPAAGKLRAGFEEKPLAEEAIAAARRELAAGDGLLPPFYWAAFVLSGTGR